jgi:UDP-N-acetylmuramyl pentapeptide synthase
VLGDMLELGPTELELHAQLGDQVRASGVDLLVTVGTRARAIAADFPGEVHSAADATEAASLVPSLLRPGDVVLVKGSRAVGLELVCRALEAADNDADRAQLPSTGSPVQTAGRPSTRLGG